MASRSNRSKKYKVKRPLKPERIISAKSKKVIASKPVSTKKNHKPRINLKKLYIGIAFLLTLILILGFMFWNYIETTDAVNSSNQSSNTNKSLNDNWQTITKVGNNKQLLSEIENYSSLPADSLNIILKSTRIAKVKCISNAELVANYKFAVVNVVYDKYILATSNCGGSTNIVLANLGTGWAVIHEGNGLMECNSVYSLELPKGVASHCVTDGVRYLNPNP